MQTNPLGSFLPALFLMFALCTSLVAGETPGEHDYWPGKYVKLPANTSKPAKLTYVTITKSEGKLTIEGYEGRFWKLDNLGRSLDEVVEGSIIRHPLVRMALGTATLNRAGVVQIVIDVFEGDNHFYLIRAEPAKGP